MASGGGAAPNLSEAKQPFSLEAVVQLSVYGGRSIAYFR
jgi:hypothetical protein